MSNFFSALSSIAVNGPLASRAYIPLFIIAFLGHNPEICDTLSIPYIIPPRGMEWLISDWFVTIVGVMAVLEILADKNPEIQELILEIETYSKPICAALITLMVLPPDTEALADPYIQTAGIIGLSGAMALMNAGITWVLVSLRKGMVGLLGDSDPDDDTGLRFVLSVAEDIWASVGVLICLILPLVAVVLVFMLLGLALAWRLVARWIENRNRGACPDCGHAMQAKAVTCAGCQVSVAPSELLTWRLWQSSPLEWNAETKQNHQLRLLSQRRCPQCAEHVKTRKLGSTGCQHCGFVLDSVTADTWFAAYHRHLMQRGWRLMLPLSIVALLPAVGTAVAIVSIKLMLVSPFSIFVGRGTKFFTRWCLRLVTAVLFLLGSLPFVSVLVVPLLLLIHLWVYGGLAKRALIRTTERRMIAA